MRQRLWRAPEPMFGVLVALSIGCGSSEEPRSPQGTDTGSPDILEGNTVALVNGVGVAIDDVQQLASEEGLAPQEALHTAVRRELLRQEAERRGYAARAELGQAVGRELVRALLHQVLERDVTSDDIGADDLEEAFVAQGERWNAPEKRGAVHLLVRVPEDGTDADRATARRIATSFHAVALAASHPREILEAAHEQPAELELRFEVLDPFAANGTMEQPFEAAVFGVEGPGLVPTLVETSFGVHVVVVTEVQAPLETSLAAAEPTLRTELLALRRHEALLALEADLLRASGVVPDEGRLRQALGARLEFADEPSR
ncbi:MAG: peptidylprolyl isomerase [Myxococcota bacterium]